MKAMKLYSLSNKATCRLSCCCYCGSFVPFFPRSVMMIGEWTCVIVSVRGGEVNTHRKAMKPHKPQQSVCFLEGVGRRRPRINIFEFGGDSLYTIRKRVGRPYTILYIEWNTSNSTASVYHAKSTFEIQLVADIAPRRRAGLLHTHKNLIAEPVNPV